MDIGKLTILAGGGRHLYCGCSACASICPKHCITMQADYEGFLHPKVNEADCIDCGLCEKVCHELYTFEERKPQKVYAAIISRTISCELSFAT